LQEFRSGGNNRRQRRLEELMTTVTSEKYYERYNGMPISPLKQNMELFEAGALSIGVEFRVLTDKVIESLGLKEIAASNGYPTLDDNGVSLHVFLNAVDGNYERLRFDCFKNDPHYHYLSVKNKTQDVIHIDATVAGDPVTWAMNLIWTRLIPMLQRADVDDAGKLVEVLQVEKIMPLVAAAVSRARYGVNRSEVEQSALTRGTHQWDTSTERSWAKHSNL
jgi:hypothetical protein